MNATSAAVRQTEARLSSWTVGEFAKSLMKCPKCKRDTVSVADVECGRYSSKRFSQYQCFSDGCGWSFTGNIQGCK